MRALAAVGMLLVIVMGCGDGAGGAAVVNAAPAPDQGAAAPPVDAGLDGGGTAGERDILSTGLALDLSTLTGRAEIVLAPSSSHAVSLEAGGLSVRAVTSAAGPVAFEVQDGQLVLASVADRFTVEYSFQLRHDFDGWLPQGVTFLWPRFCGNLFPCHSSPADGTTFRLAVDGVPDGMTAIYPAEIAAPAPSYMIALAVGDYTQHDLGVTGAGTSVHYWSLAGDADASAATAHLRDIFDWYETHLGPYSFGRSVGSVSAAWGPGAYGGMEHHPFWHVGSDSMGDEVTHAHEAAHGWFGDGVRIRCWQDFVLSEGTVTYLAARSIEATSGADRGAEVWAEYQDDLTQAVQLGDTIAYPEGCQEIDLLSDPLWSNVPYMKGAFFYRAVEEAMGREAFDEVLASFYQAHVGGAARMDDLLEAIAAAGFDPSALADGWLRSLGTPQARRSAPSPPARASP